MSEEIDNAIQFIRKHPETLGYAAGMTSGAALTWFANKFLEKKKRINMINGILLGGVLGRTGAGLYKIMQSRHMAQPSST